MGKPWENRVTISGNAEKTCFFVEGGFLIWILVVTTECLKIWKRCEKKRLGTGIRIGNDMKKHIWNMFKRLNRSIDIH